MCSGIKDKVFFDKASSSPYIANGYTPCIVCPPTSLDKPGIRFLLRTRLPPTVPTLTLFRTTLTRLRPPVLLHLFRDIGSACFVFVFFFRPAAYPFFSFIFSCSSSAQYFLCSVSVLIVAGKFRKERKSVEVIFFPLPPSLTGQLRSSYRVHG